LELPDGQVIWARVEDVGPRDVVRPGVRQVLNGFVETVRGVAANVRDAVVDAQPDEVSVEFGVDLSIAGEGVVAALAGIAGTAAVRVTLTWTRQA
jgi:hypothetical protein